MKFNINRPIKLAILTVSDTRTKETDQSGILIKKIAMKKNLKIVDYQICKDDINTIKNIIVNWSELDSIDVIITTGGSGIAKKDCTIEAIRPLFTKEIEGFGELFRTLSFLEDVGTHAMLSRAVAGVTQDKAIFVLPGSAGAVKFAMNRLIIPEINHFVFEVKKHLQENIM